MEYADLKRYYQKSGDDSIETDNLIVNEHGFFSWMINSDGDFVILNVYGDGPYWEQVGYELATKYKCKKAIFATKRNPEGFIKRFKGFKVIGYLLERDV